MEQYSRLLRTALAALILMPTGACSIMSAVGPSYRAVVNEEGKVDNADIRIVELTSDITQKLQKNIHTSYFAESLGEGYPIDSMIGKGDVLDISVWEAPPAALFGTMGGDTRLSSVAPTSRGTSIPEQMVDSDGYITMPFAGRILADGKTPQQIARDIDRKLQGVAHQPQTIIRLVRNSTRNVTIVGDVANSTRVPLTARGERVLDILAAAGGVKQPISKMTLQVTRGDRIASMPLEVVIKDPRENIRLQPDDIVTALFQPYSFTALGAIGRNDELPFEGTGITLIQALGRVSGLQDARADVRGVFVFRFENPEILPVAEASAGRLTPDGKVPVIYRINMKDPAGFFVAQNFPIQNRDVLYVSNAPLADIQKFVNVISSTILPVATATTIVRQ